MKKVWGFFWLIMAVLGGCTLLSTMQLPSESRNAFLFGMSLIKLLMCAGIALLALCCLAGGILSFTERSAFFSGGKAAGIIVYIVSFALVLGVILLTPPVGRTAFERSLLERLTPLAYWALAFILWGVPLLLVQHRSMIRRKLSGSSAAFILGLVLLILMAGSICFALYTGIGLDPISGTFYRQGVSLLEGHLILPLLILYPLLPLFIFLSAGLQGKPGGKILTVILSIAVWAAAVYFWQTVPFEGRSYFAPALRAPNYNFYPASDAENYDLLAQSVLLGNGFRNGLTVVRPIYAAFLALLHLIFRNNYMQLTNGQILLLALIPVLVWLIGKNLRHPEAGILAAVWVIWREVYTIRMTPFVQVSNSRLLMSDLPAMLIVAAVVLSAAVWVNSGKRSLHALICGGLIGLSMLLRTQCFVLVPAVWLLFLCSKRKAAVKWRSLLLSLCGLILVFGPWVCWGKIHPNETSNADFSEGQYLLHLYQKAAGMTDGTESLPELILHHPAEVAYAVGSHFLNNEISSLLVLPVRLLKPAEAEQCFYEEDLFWYRENARETLQKNGAVICVYLIIITAGLISAYWKAGAAGTAPILFHLTYNLGNALALTSGFRFILPVDWVLFFYFAFGCAAILKFFCRITLFGEKYSDDSLSPATEDVFTVSPFAWAGTVLCLIVTGLILPFCDAFIPRHFPETNQQIIEEKWLSVSQNAQAILSDVPEDQLVFLEGRAFYPRYYKAGEGDSGGSSSAKRGLDTDRLVWMFHSDRPAVLNCPLLPDQVPGAITGPVPDPMDVIVAGIPQEDYIRVIEMIPLGTGE